MKVITWLLDNEIQACLLDSDVDHTTLIEVLQAKGSMQIRVENMKPRTQSQLNVLLDLM